MNSNNEILTGEQVKGLEKFYSDISKCRGKVSFVGSESLETLLFAASLLTEKGLEIDSPEFCRNMIKSPW